MAAAEALTKLPMHEKYNELAEVTMVNAGPALKSTENAVGRRAAAAPAAVSVDRHAPLCKKGLTCA